MSCDLGHVELAAKSLLLGVNHFLAPCCEFVQNKGTVISHLPWLSEAYSDYQRTGSGRESAVVTWFRG